MYDEIVIYGTYKSRQRELSEYVLNRFVPIKRRVSHHESRDFDEHVFVAELCVFFNPFT